MSYRKALGFLTVLASLFSCSLSPFDDAEEPVPPEKTSISEESSLFRTDGESEKFVLETNDTKYLSANGRTFWTAKETNSSESFEPISVTVCKESGRTEAGFGIVFCSQELDETPFMLAVLINANGLYTAGKVSNGIFSHITGWRNSVYINKGLGIQNVISVSCDSESKNFTLSINGYAVTAFAVSENIVFNGSKSGFAVVIANNENFPENPVKVTFEKARQLHTRRV